ncbi:hypothetical protein CK203_047490 [Vitis vinifera]|uniref:Uncharacterized protein n=1 Tax=Vitis vinifera TaxID=29760 RepID=A0A438H5W4_VITVI|nr:hypothetical protein CK203_047490 [Vitis vinifera]
MAKRKERTLAELYNGTEMILEPEAWEFGGVLELDWLLIHLIVWMNFVLLEMITPVLRGSCRMQGPVDETDYDIQTNTVRKQGNLRYLSLGLLNSPLL